MVTVMNNRGVFLKNSRKYLLIFLKSLLLLCAFSVLAYSSVKLYNYNKERIENEKLADEVVTKSSSIEVAPISVDFEKLKQENEDIIAWLYCNETPINYPVAQADDNSYYLRKSTNGTYSSSGTLFVDYQNEADFSDNNTIIYGHNMRNVTMFGSLPEYRKQEYFDKHPIMYLLTPDNEYKIELIAGVTVSSASPIYKLPLEAENKEDFIFELIKKSTFSAEYTFSSNHKYVMLSTCLYDYDEARYVLVGLLKEL